MKIFDIRQWILEMGLDMAHLPFEVEMNGKKLLIRDMGVEHDRKTHAPVRLLMNVEEL